LLLRDVLGVERPAEIIAELGGPPLLRRLQRLAEGGRLGAVVALGGGDHVRDDRLEAVVDIGEHRIGDGGGARRGARARRPGVLVGWRRLVGLVLRGGLPTALSAGGERGDEHGNGERRPSDHGARSIDLGSERAQATLRRCRGPARAAIAASAPGARTYAS